MRKRNKGDFNHRYFSKIDSEGPAYWLGYLMADGCIIDNLQRGSKQLRLHCHEKDRWLLDTFNACLDSSNNVLRYENAIRLTFSSDLLCNDLEKFGCTPRKSLTLKFPDIPEELYPHFIRGYFDGDGSFFVSGQRLFFSLLGTQQFLEKIKDIIDVGVKLKDKGSCFELAFGSKRDCPRIFEFLYKEANFFLERKRSIALDWMRIHIYFHGTIQRMVD